MDIRYVNVPVSDGLDEFARRCIERALRPFSEQIGRVSVDIRDVNGPRGGSDKRCSVAVELAAIERKVVVSNTSSDPYEAVQAACNRLGESVSRALTRQRQLDHDSSAIHRPSKDLSQVAASTRHGSRIQVTTADHDRLQTLIETSADSRDAAAAEALADELDRAELVPAERIAGTVVTMHSRVVFEDQQTGATREVSLVYPHEAAAEEGRISVLAPIGSALLGLSIGQTIDWPVPRGEMKRLKIVKIVYQPEEAGHLHL